MFKACVEEIMLHRKKPVSNIAVAAGATRVRGGKAVKCAVKAYIDWPITCTHQTMYDIARLMHAHAHNSCHTHSHTTVVVACMLWLACCGLHVVVCTLLRAYCCLHSVGFHASGLLCHY